MLDMQGKKMIRKNYKPATQCISSGGGNMHSPTYDEIADKISLKSNLIASLSKSFRYSLSKSTIYSRIIRVIYISKRLIHYLNKMEKIACVECNEKECKYLIDIKENLSVVVSGMDESIRTQEEQDFPVYLINMQKELAEEFDNKLENYWISTDKDIQGLTSAIADKINREHGIHAKRSS